jgi:glycerol-3-phosphate cytidylyltransferase-like family protein
MHVGHVRMLSAARNFGRVVVILNSDGWVAQRKGFLLIPWEERREILLSLRSVDDVVGVDDSDGTVCKALRDLRPQVFGNGGGRTLMNTPERAVCHELGIVLVCGLGGGERDQQTLDLRDRIREAK